MCTYDLKYNDYNTNVSEGLVSLLASSDIFDITLAVEGKLFKVHKVILSIFSPYFREIFCENPAKDAIFFMKNVKHRIMKDLLVFMYEGKVKIPEEDFNLFVETAHELKIKGLTADVEPAEKKTLEAPVSDAVPVLKSILTEQPHSVSFTPVGNSTSMLKHQSEVLQTCQSEAGMKKLKAMSATEAMSVSAEAFSMPSSSWMPDLPATPCDIPVIVNITEDDDVVEVKAERNYETDQCDIGPTALQYMMDEDAIEFGEDEDEDALLDMNDQGENNFKGDEDSMVLAAKTTVENKFVYSDGEPVTVTLCQSEKTQQVNALIHNGMRYSLSSRAKDRTTWRCSMLRRLRCMAIILLTNDDRIVILNKHNHGVRRKRTMCTINTNHTYFKLSFEDWKNGDSRRKCNLLLE